MASGRARLPPTPQANGAGGVGGSGVGSSGSSSRPLAEMHTSNNNTTYGSHVAGLDMSAATTGSVQDMQMLENLTDQERQIILNVLNRDENVRQADAARIMLLRAELFNLRKAKGNVKALVAGGGSLDRPTYIESTRSCSRCGTELGRIINRGAPCRSCRLRVCKGCREFSTRTTDWVCVVCHKQIELQAASEDWMSEYTDGTTTTTTTAAVADIRRTSQVIAGTRTSSTSIASAGDYLPVGATELIKKSIRRSWTISNAEDENRQCGGGGGGTDPQQYSHLPRKQSQSSYPSLVRYPYINPCTMAEYSQEDEFDNELQPPMGRRMPPRQSTLPNPDAGMFYGSNNNLMPPSLSPNKGLSPSPQYSPYHTDNENDDDPQHATSPIAARYKIRRQSTLPCRPNEANHEIGAKLMSTSPNSRTNLYQPSTMTTTTTTTTGRSPDKSELAGGDQPSPRYPPFVRQSTFPSNSSDPFFLQIQAHSQQQPLPQQPGQQRHLPTSPNRMLFNKSPDQAAPDQESADVATNRPPANRFQMTRQATLPNPDQHVKLLPTSPPKKQQQLSPHSIKRSPEFARQNTLPAPDSMNSLSVHQHGPKFMPISPRQKQSFLFPQSAQPAPRPFLSQQHFPTMLADEGQAVANAAAAVTPGSVSIGGAGAGAVTGGGVISALVGTGGASGGPPGTAAAHHHSAKMIKVRSHSNEEYSLNRALTVEGRRLLPEIPANRSPRLKTFAEAKQAMMDEYGGGLESAATSSTTINNDSTLFDEDEEASYYINEDRLRLRASMAPVSTIKSAESFLNEADFPTTCSSGAGGVYPVDSKTENRRLRRRKSRDLPVEPEAVASSNEDEPIKQHRKPETMRSISEDSPGNKTVKMTPRRSLSHPEKDTQQMQNTRKTEITKIPSPRPLAEILERAQRSIKLPSPRRKAFKSMDQGCESEMAANGISPLMTAMSQSPSMATTATPGGSTGAIARTGPRKISAFQQILQNQRLQKRDSKSLDVVASKLMEEKYGGYPEADEDKSKSLDDGIFCGDKNSDDNSSDEQINLIDKKHKTYLGEDEIQHAVEAAAVLFKKVVLQRREEKRKDEEEASGTLESGSSPVIDAGDRNGATGGSNQELSTAAAAAVKGGSSGTGTGPHRSVATSPIGSVGSEHWPSQSDEDIDRLVALHQNRASLSSLGLRSDSMASVYSGAGEGRYGTVTVRGQIEFGMQYNYKQSALEIHVKQCRDLAAVDAKRNRSDPYVKVYLLPDKSKGGKRKTKVKKHTLNPVFDEVLRFHISLAGLQSRTVWMTVWHSDMFGRNDFLGEVMMGLQDKMFDNPAPQWYQLQERSEPFEDLSAYKGDIIVGLKYIPPESDGGTPQHHASSSSHHNGSGSSGSGGGGPTGTLNLRKFSTRSITSTSSNSSGQSRGALHVLVKEAKNLQAVKANGTCDAFCKSYLLPDKNRSSKQKTPVVKRSNSPVWNYTFIYEDISLAELSERGLELTIWDHDRLASNEFLGGVRFSLGTGKHGGRTVDWMDSTGRELSLWQNMINRPNFWVEGALVLRPSLDNAKFTS